MELDEMQAKWAEHDRKLDESIRLNRQLLRETYTRRARFALWRLATLLALGALTMLVVIISLGRFTAVNWPAPRFVIPAILLDIAAIAALAALTAQIALALGIDYSQPVAVIQKRLETLRRLRIRYTQAICLTMTLTWAPIFIVLMKGFLGLDVYLLFGIQWLVINVAIGLVVLALGIRVLKKYGPRMSQTFLKELAGSNLNAASGFLATLAEFEQEPR